MHLASQLSFDQAENLIVFSVSQSFFLTQDNP